MNLTPALCSVHTHSLLCDGKCSLAEMARAAEAAGVRYFGASGHSHTPAPQDEGEVLPADMTAYRSAVLALRERYAGRMEVLLGLEEDSCADVTPAGFDYWIGSVHQLFVPGAGGYHVLDWDEEKLTRACRMLCGGDYFALARRYYEQAAAMAARRPTILGHLDLIVKFNAGGRFFDEADPRYRACALEALHAADPRATLLEINTGAVAKGWRAQPYPGQFLLREWRGMGGEVILTADAHAAGQVIFGYDQAAQWARAAGFSRTMLLTMAGTLACPL